MDVSQKRDEALEQVSSHNAWWKKRALEELNWMRSGRTRLAAKRDEIFTFEEILPTLERLLSRKIPHHNLAGSIVMDAIRQKLITETGQLKHTERAEKHSRRAMSYRWVA